MTFVIKEAIKLELREQNETAGYSVARHGKLLLQAYLLA
jgi:hypothetical protein